GEHGRRVDHPLPGEPPAAGGRSPEVVDDRGEEPGRRQVGPGGMRLGGASRDGGHWRSSSRTSGSRSIVSASYGAIASTMMWRKPSSTTGRRSSAIFRGDPT